MSSKIWILLFVAFAWYSAVVYLNCGPTSIAPDELVNKGWDTWQKKNCQSCHQIYGLGGYMGPDLTNAASIKSTDYLKTFIQFGSGRMPNFKLNEEEVNELLAFLQWVDKSGKGTVSEHSVHWSGTYIIEQ